MKRSRAWLVGTVVLAVGVLGIGRTIMNRKAEQARLTQSQNEPAGRQTLSASDLVQAQRAEWRGDIGAGQIGGQLHGDSCSGTCRPAQARMTA